MERALSRLGRYRRALGYFYLLYPGMAHWRIQKLVDLAVCYWERPERFK